VTGLETFGTNNLAASQTDKSKRTALGKGTMNDPQCYLPPTPRPSRQRIRLTAVILVCVLVVALIGLVGCLAVAMAAVLSELAGFGLAVQLFFAPIIWLVEVVNTLTKLGLELMSIILEWLRFLGLLR
jgi:hypothetical protein